MSAVTEKKHSFYLSTVWVKHALKRCILGKQKLVIRGGKEQVQAIERSRRQRVEVLRETYIEVKKTKPFGAEERIGLSSKQRTERMGANRKVESE